MVHQTQIIAAFPATGKTTLFLRERNRYLDSDSSNFTWVKDANGDNTKERNPDFPENYIRHIVGNIGNVEAIFVSTHEVVRDALVAAGVNFTLVYPEKGLKKEYLRRFTERGNPKPFIELVKTNWEKWIDECAAQRGCDKIALKSGQYLSDIFPFF